MYVSNDQEGSTLTTSAPESLSVSLNCLATYNQRLQRLLFEAQAAASGIYSRTARQILQKVETLTLERACQTVSVISSPTLCK